MTDFTEALHPRATDGKFTAKEGWPPETRLDGVIGFKGSPDSPAVSSLEEEEEFPLGYGRADDEETERILKWVEAEGVTATADYDGFGRYAKADGGESDGDAHNYNVTLRTDDGREMKLGYHMGAAHDTAPTIAQVLQSTAADAWSYDDNSREEFIANYGDPNDESDSAGETYEAVKKQTAEFKDFVGDDYDFIVYGE